MSTRIFDLPAAQSTNTESVVAVVVPTVLTVAGCSGGQAFFNGNYHMAADGFYYKTDDGFAYRTAPGHTRDTDRPSLKKVRLPTHTQMQGPYGNQEEVIIYQDRYELHAPANNPGGIPGGLWFRSTGYPSTPASVDSTYAQYNFDGGQAVPLPSITTNGSGVYNQTFKLPLASIGAAQTPWTNDIDGDGRSLNAVYDLFVQNQAHLYRVLVGSAGDTYGTTLLSTPGSGSYFSIEVANGAQTYLFSDDGFITNGGLQILGPQQAAVADATSLTVVAQLNALLARLRAHGLIAT